MRAIDTNVLVRLVVRDEPQQVKKAEAYVADGAWVSLLVLAETVWVLQSVYELGPKQIATFVSMVLEHDRLVLQEPDVIRSALGLFRKRQSAGFTDCLVVATAANAGYSPLGTFDLKMSRLSGVEKL